MAHSFAARMAGVPFVLSLMLVVWLADIGAYFAGKAFGRHKLAPAISPGKTWEGAVGGWLAVVIVASAAIVLHAFEPTVLACTCTWQLSGAVSARSLSLTILVVGISVVGDLFESMLETSGRR